MKLSTKIAYNAIIQFISKAAATTLGLVSVAIMARHLGLAGFGQYTTVMTFLSFFGIIADLGLTLVTVQMISKPGVNEEKVLSNLFSLRFVSALFFLILAPITALFFPYGSIIRWGIALGSVSFLFTALNQVIVGLFQKHLRMDKVSIAEIFGRAVLLAGILYVQANSIGLAGYIIATVIGSAANFIALFLFARSISKIKFAFDRSIWRETLSKSWPLSITIILNLLYLKTDTLLLSVWKSEAEVGIYGAAYKVIDVVVTIPFIFCGIILPVLTKHWHEKNRTGFISVAQKSFDAMAIFTAPLVIGAEFTSSKLMALVAGKEFIASGPSLRILILAAAAIFIGSVAAHAIIAIDKQKKMITAYAFTAASSIAGYMIFIPRFSYTGAAWVTVYSEIIIAAFSLYFAWKYARFIPRLEITAKALGAALIMGIFLYFTPSLSVLPQIFIGAAVYVIALFSLRGISKQVVIELIERQ
jgi:O-antigen/teichoic acid export membrane protein